MLRRAVFLLLLTAPFALADAPVHHFSAFATVSPLAAFDYPSDGHGPEGKGIVELGLGVSASLRLGAHLDLGVALHYDHGESGADRIHVFSLSCLGAYVLPVGA